jgi:hypothetical protein
MNSDGHLTQEEVVAVAAAHGRPVVPNLAPAARLAISDHVAGCPDCRARLRAPAPGGAANV